MILNAEIHRLLDESVLCWLATSSTAGQPSVSPKEIFSSFHDDSIIIANVASPGSARNIRENPRACVSFINVFTQRGYKITGTASYLRSRDETFSEIQQKLRLLSGDEIPFKSAFRVMAEDISEILAPRYRLFPETTEAGQIRDAMVSYGVQPKN